MASKTIGIEIGNDSIKLAVCSGKKASDMVSVKLPDNLVREGRITSSDALIEQLKLIRKEYKIPGGNASVILPRQVVVTSIVTMPIMGEDEVKLNLPFEFRDIIGQDTAKYHYDYAVLNVTDTHMELFAAAVRKDIIDEYFTMFKKAGFTMKVATPVEMAWQNLVTQNDKLPNELVIVDIGHTSTNVFIYANKKYVMGRTIDIGGQMLDEAISMQNKVDTHIARTHKETNFENVLSLPQCVDMYNTLAIEIMKVINFYRYDTQTTSLADLYYCGGMSRIEDLRTAIIKATDLTAHRILRLVPGGESMPENCVTAGIAVGAGIQQ